MLTAVFFLVSIIQLLFLVLAVRHYLQNRSIYTAIVALVIFGLFYDNSIIALGQFIGEGDTLRTLNSGRFMLHALLTPLLILFAVATARRLNVKWMEGTAVFIGFGILTLLLIGLGAYTDIIDLSLIVERETGTLRYVNANSAGPPIPSIVVILIMIVIGAFIWRQHKWWVLCVGSILMFILAGAGASILILSNIGEVIFAGAIVWTDMNLDEIGS